MKIDDLILELQDILGSAKSVPFSRRQGNG